MDEIRIPPRSRFGNVVNAKDVPPEQWWQGQPRYRGASRELAVALRARDLGYCLTAVPPGSAGGPYHFHHSEEEMFFVLEGRGVLRQGDETNSEERIELGPGDCVSFPPGTRIAHQFLNETKEPFVYLAVSTRIASDVAEFPDSDKVLVRSTRLIVRRTPKLDYFDGEG